MSSSTVLTDVEFENILDSNDLWEYLGNPIENDSASDVIDREAVLEELERLAVEGD